MVESSPTLMSPVTAPASVARVLFFGPVRFLVEVPHFELPCHTDLEVPEFWSRLLARFPQLAALRPSLRLARHGEFLSSEAQVHPGDEIAVIPPVSGG